jgi:hypothetical protein
LFVAPDDLVINAAPLMDQLRVRDALPERDRGEIDREVGVAERAADQSQTRMGCERIGVRPHDLEAPHPPSPAK